MSTNVNISGTLSTFVSESDISISTANPSNIIAAANATDNQEQFWSIDGGVTWHSTTLAFESPDDNQTDPGVAWTSDGTAWATTLGMQGSDLICRVYKSPDAGATWAFESTPSGSQTAADRQTLWVDRSATSPYHDNMYLIWHNGAPAFVTSRAGPGGTWSGPSQVSGAETTGSAVGGDIKTNENGDVFAFWPDDGTPAVFVAKSTNGGGTFGTPVEVTNTFGSFKVPIPAQDKREAALYVSGGAYSGAGLDMVYVCRTDLAGGSGCNAQADAPGSDTTSACKTRIWFSRSHDGGAHWDASIKINDQAGLNDQFFPRLAVDSATGRLMVVYYDTVADPGRLKADIWMQFSDDDGATWSGAMRVTDASTDETNSASDVFGDQFGDYIGLSTQGGRFFACWTDRRNGGDEQIWGAPLVIPECEFIIDKSTFGQDEVAANASYPSAFWIAVDGFTNAALGFAAASDLNANPPNPVPAISATLDPALNPALTAAQLTTISAHLPSVNAYGPAPVIAEDPTLALDLQRFMYPFTISFPDSTAFGALGAQQSAIVTLHATLTVGNVTVTASAAIELAKGEDPYFTDVDPQHPAQFPFWLSYDLRFFKVTPAQPHQMFSVPNPADASQAPAYIASVLHNLNNPALIMNGDTFETTLAQDEELSALEFLPTDSSSDPVFNFAVARVRLVADSVTTTTTPVRVFFRLFQAQSTVSDFNENTTYRWGTDGSPNHKIALLGVQNDQNGNPEYVTMPCFATKRINLDAPAAMNTQHDDPNAQTITTVAGAEVDTYFGCWLDVNQPGQTFLIPTPPASPSQWDGPWPGTTSVNGLISMSPHQCVIAEIRFDDTPIPPGATSSSSDKLAQRNIAWIDGPNPGIVASRVMSHPFEVRASLPSVDPVDELIIGWGTTPAGSTAQLYLPAANAAQIVALASTMYPSHRLTVADPNTIAFPAGGTTFVPVPKGEGRYAGLLTITLPEGVKRGDAYDVVVRQITEASIAERIPNQPPGATEFAAAAGGKESRSSWRRLLGAFQFAIRIKTKEELLYPEERLLAWLKWRVESLPQKSRWYPVLQRYLGIVVGLVGGFGGNPGAISGSPEGNVPGHGPEPRRPHLREYCGKVSGIFYDAFGDFEGFALKTERCRERWFAARERGMERLVDRAWRERIFICVFVESRAPECAVAIEFRDPGECRDPRPDCDEDGERGERGR